MEGTQDSTPISNPTLLNFTKLTQDSNPEVKTDSNSWNQGEMYDRRFRDQPSP